MGDSVVVRELINSDIDQHFAPIPGSGFFMNASNQIEAFSPSAKLIRGISIEFSGNQNLGGKMVVIFDMPAYLNGQSVMIMYWDAVQQMWIELFTTITKGGHCIAYVDFPGFFVLVAK